MAGLEPVAVAAMATGSTWTGAVGGMQGGMRRERVERVERVYLNGARVQVVLVGVANANVAGSGCPVAAGSRGESTKAGWTKVGS